MTGAPGSGLVQSIDDPWDFWAFRTSGNGSLDGQASSSTSNLFGNLSAGRTTEAWKLSVGGNYSRNVQRFSVSDGTTVRETRQDWDVEAFSVRSIGEHWAAGVRGDVGSSTFLDPDLRWSVKPGLEFNVCPNDESSRRSLTVQYLLGPTHFDYREQTIFLKVRETLVQHSLTGRLALVQPWGRWTTSLTGDQYLHGPSKQSVTLSGHFNIRPFRGFSVRMGGQLLLDPGPDLRIRRGHDGPADPAPATATGAQLPILHFVRNRVPLRLDVQKRRASKVWRVGRWGQDVLLNGAHPPPRHMNRALASPICERVFVDDGYGG